MITSTRPLVALDGRYSVTETCAVLGIHRGTLQRYTKKGFIKVHFRRADSRKVYEGRDIIRLWLALI